MNLLYIIIGIVVVVLIAVICLRAWLRSRVDPRCRGGHAWNRCKCERCGEIRDEQHDWDGCKCKLCSHTRDEQHQEEYVTTHVIFNDPVCTLDQTRTKEYRCPRCGKGWTIELPPGVLD